MKKETKLKIMQIIQKLTNNKMMIGILLQIIKKSRI
jgi:hypothetical protein